MFLVLGQSLRRALQVKAGVSPTIGGGKLMRVTEQQGMESVNAKLRRAEHHLSSLSDQLREVGRTHVPTMILKSDEQSAWLVVYYPEPYLSLSNSVVFGDFLYNLRSALDALIYALVVGNGAVPTRKTAFPIDTDPDVFADRTQNGKKTDVLAGVPAQARAIVKSLQPFTRGSPGLELDPLHQLNVMCNQDKHRTSHILLGYATEAHFAIHLDDRIARVSSPGPLIGHGPWTLPIPAAPRELKSNHRIEALGAADFLFRTDDPWQGRPVLDFARNCLQYVENTAIAAFAPLYK